MTEKTMTYEEIEQRIEYLEKQIEYENKRLNVCGYGKRDLLELEEMKEELELLQNQLDEMK